MRDEALWETARDSAGIGALVEDECSDQDSAGEGRGGGEADDHERMIPVRPWQRMCARVEFLRYVCVNLDGLRVRASERQARGQRASGRTVRAAAAR